MAAYVGINCTKFAAGGSGDNYINDGLIKSVAKIWTDTYTVGTTALSTADTITIALIPPGKKIVAIDVIHPAVTTEGVSTGSTLAVGITGDLDKFIDDDEVGVTMGSIDGKQIAVNSLNNPDGFMYETVGTTNTAILLTFGRKATTATSYTIGTVVYYV
jgi:hypothetical protein